MRLETQEDFERVRERLRRRDLGELIELLISLAHVSGPVGDQIRTSIVGDDVDETVDSVRQRIAGLAVPSEYEHRHSRGRDVGTTLDFLVDSVERLVLLQDPKAAFELLIALFEADTVAMENCGDHVWEVACAYQRATGVMREAARQLPRAEVEMRVKLLIEEDGYGVRSCLTSVFAGENTTGDGAAPQA